MSCNLEILKLGNQNLAYLYEFGDGKDQPFIKAFHNKADSTQFFVDVFTSSLFEKNQKIEVPVIVYLNCLLYPSYQDKNILDTIQIQLKNPNYKQEILRFQFSARTDSLNQYLASIEVGSNQSPIKIKNIIELDRGDFFGEQYYLIQETNKKQAQSNSFLADSDSVQLLGLFASLIDSLKIHRIKKELEIPLPPFYKTDFSTPKLSFDTSFTQNVSKTIALPKPGLYYVQNDLDTAHGILLYRFGNQFPLLTETQQLIQPLRYLTTKSEFEALKSDKNPKTAVDDFWLEIGGNRERGRQLIKEYYNRVQYANRFFTSLQAGWATDRGLIYIIYGPPNLIFKDFDKETWIYSNNIPEQVIEFWFSKIENPYSNNYFKLNRNLKHEKSWYYTVRKWRNGIVINPKF